MLIRITEREDGGYLYADSDDIWDALDPDGTNDKAIRLLVCYAGDNEDTWEFLTNELTDGERTLTDLCDAYNLYENRDEPDMEAN